MRNNLLQLTAALSLAVAAPLSAGQWDKLTKLDVKETILIPGKQLPPGKYVMKLMDSQSNRHIVMIYNEDQSKLEATILAIPNSRLQPTGDTALQYWETPAGVPPALRAWFYPGDNFGQEFAYPKNMADEISRVNNNAKVMYYEGANQTTTADNFKSTEVHNAPEVAANNTPAPAPATAPAPEPVTQAAAQPEPAPAPAPVAPEPAPQPVVTAQNRAPEPAPVADPAPMPADQLPQTASPLPLMGLTGAVLLGVAALLRNRTVRS